MSSSFQKQRSSSRQMHPRVFHAAVALAFLYVLSAWYGFGAGRYADYLLGVVTGFVLFSIGLPLLAWRVRQRNRPDGDRRGTEASFEDWAVRDVDVAQGRTKGYVAAIEILLPLAAVAFGMTSFALVARFA